MNRAWIKRSDRILRVIHISSEQRPRELLQSLEGGPAMPIKNGEIVLHLREGQITRIGQMLPFRRCFERIMKEVEAPIIPEPEGVWAASSASEKAASLRNCRGGILIRLPLTFDRLCRTQANRESPVRRRQQLLADAWNAGSREWNPASLVHPHGAPAIRPVLQWRMPNRPKLSLARRLRGWCFSPGGFGSRGLDRKWWLAVAAVGAGALANFAALLMGKIPVNLNYTVSEENAGLLYPAVRHQNGPDLESFLG